MREMLLSAQSLDHAAGGDGSAHHLVDRSAVAPYLLALALDMCVNDVPKQRATDELVKVASGSPMAILAARSLASSLLHELPDDQCARDVVDLLTVTVRRARVEAFGTESIA
jgi:hypothetical protein